MEKDYSNIDNIIISFLKDEISLEEKKILEDWLASDVSNKTHFNQVYKIWNSSELFKSNTNEVEKELRKMKFRLNKEDEAIKEKKLKQIRFAAMKWAAVIVISICTGALINYQFNKTQTTDSSLTRNEIVVPMGSKSQVQLPDGTIVTLNAGSKLNYTMEYGKQLREIEFSGEAYFKVAKQKEKPFIVHTPDASIKALGTEFNISAYPDENFSETILAEGSIAISLNSKYKNLSDREQVVLKAGQKAIITKHSNKPNSKIQFSMNVEKCDPKIETSWKDKRWIIKGTSLSKLAVSFSRRYNVNVQIKDDELNDYKFSGIIENETLEQVFDIMEFALPVVCTIEKNNVNWTVNHNTVKEFKKK